MNGHSTMWGKGCSETSPTSLRRSPNPEGGAARNARVSAVATMAAAATTTAGASHASRRSLALAAPIRARASDTPV